MEVDDNSLTIELTIELLSSKEFQQAKDKEVFCQGAIWAANTVKKFKERMNTHDVD